jgi:hypothetical protein
MFANVKFSNAVKFFEQGFRQRHNSLPYDVDKPCLFVGCYSTEDFNNIVNHRHPKQVMILGADVPAIDHLKYHDITFCSDKQLILNIFKDNNLKFINGCIELKDFSNFKPAPLGDKIYCYINRDDEAHKAKHKVELLQHAINYFGKDRFIFGTNGKTEAEVIEDYKQCFINIQLNPFAGYTTALEMAKMGRKSISNTIAPFAIPFTNEQHITNLILEQWKKI